MTKRLSCDEMLSQAKMKIDEELKMKLNYRYQLNQFLNRRIINLLASKKKGENYKITHQKSLFQNNKIQNEKYQFEYIL